MFKHWLPHKTFHCLHQTDNCRKVFCACSSFVLVTSPKKNGLRHQWRPGVKSTRSFWTVDFVGANRHQISLKLVDISERFFSQPLHRIRVKLHTSFATNCP